MANSQNTTKAAIRLDRTVFGVTAGLVIAFVIWGLVWPENLKEVTDSALGWITTNLGWLFILSSSGFVIFALFLALSKYGRIPLGKDEDQPEYRTVSWIAMMFSAGMGIGLMFYGSYEPLFHFVSAPPEMSADDVRAAMATTMFHWGFHPWAMYAVVGLAIAYGTYRCGRNQLMSSVFAPLLGSRTSGPVGKVIDILAIFATLFGTVASLGLGALQIGSGITRSGWMDNPGTLLLVAIVALLTAAFVASAVSGIAKGIQWLSNINMVLALILAVFVFVVGPTVFILNLFPTTIGAYLGDLPFLSARSASTVNAAGEDWLGSWTIFYWAWWVSWTPFVGMFLAKISKGRTIREFVIGVMVVPTTVSLVWFSVFGGTAIWQQQHEVWSFDAEKATDSDTLFDVLQHLPLAPIAFALVMILVAIFFVSGADSASLVMGTLSSHGTDHPKRSVTIFWGVLTGAVAALMLGLGDGDQALNGIKQMAIIAALPFVVVMIGMCLSLYLDLRRDPLMVSRKIYRTEVAEHIRAQAEEIVAGDFQTDDPAIAKVVEQVQTNEFGPANAEAQANAGAVAGPSLPTDDPKSSAT